MPVTSLKKKKKKFSFSVL